MQSCAERQPGTSCLRRQEHQTRQMAHKSWRCVHSVTGRPFSGEHTVSRWAEGASAQQHDPWMLCQSDWEAAWCHRGRIWSEDTERPIVCHAVRLYLSMFKCDFVMYMCGFFIWFSVIEMVGIGAMLEHVFLNRCSYNVQHMAELSQTGHNF